MKCQKFIVRPHMYLGLLGGEPSRRPSLLPGGERERRDPYLPLRLWYGLSLLSDLTRSLATAAPVDGERTG